MSASQSSSTRSVRVALLLGILGSSTTFAQIGTSNLTGNVVDAATKAPVTDVVVTATSPAAGRAGGRDRLDRSLPDPAAASRNLHPAVREGELSGPSAARASTSALTALRLNVELLPETAGGNGDGRRLAAGRWTWARSTTGTTVNQDFIRNLAVARPGGSPARTARSTRWRSPRPRPTSDVYGVAINGAQSPEKLYLIDGLSVNNPAYGVNGTPADRRSSSTR